VVSEQLVCAVNQVNFHWRSLVMFEVDIIGEGSCLVKLDRGLVLGEKCVAEK
jgi:hypothetical protein